MEFNNLESVIREYVINIRPVEGGDSPLNHRFIWAGSEEVL